MSSTGIATGLAQPVTMGNKSGSSISNVPENLNKVKIYKDNKLLKEFKTENFNMMFVLNIMNVFVEDGLNSQTKEMIGNEFEIEHLYNLKDDSVFTTSKTMKIIQK